MTSKLKPSFSLHAWVKFVNDRLQQLAIWYMLDKDEVYS